MDTLEIDSVEIFFGNKCILNSIYLKASSGSVTGILGSNGCGKTTLLRIIFGELQPSYKSLRINGIAVTNKLLSTNQVKYLPQFHFIPKSMRVEQAFNYFDIDIACFNDIFPELKILNKQKFKTLSGGEKRIIETFLILKSRAKFILLDEPFSHVAPVYIGRIIDLIHEEKLQKAIIVTDHMYKHIVSISDKLYLIKDQWCKEIKKLEELNFYQYTNC